MSAGWSISREVDPAKLYSTLAELVDAYALEGGETVFFCENRPDCNGGYSLYVRSRFLSEADIREIERIY